MCRWRRAIGDGCAGGDGSGGTSVVNDNYTLAQTSVTRQYTAYGRIPAGQNHASAGSYLDNLVVTLNY